TRVTLGRNFHITGEAVQGIAVEPHRYGFRAAVRGIQTNLSGNGQVSTKQTIGRVAVLSDLKLRDKTGAVRTGLLGVFLLDGVEARGCGDDVDDIGHGQVIDHKAGRTQIAVNGHGQDLVGHVGFGRATAHGKVDQIPPAEGSLVVLWIAGNRISALGHTDKNSGGAEGYQ